MWFYKPASTLEQNISALLKSPKVSEKRDVKIVCSRIGRQEAFPKTMQRNSSEIPMPGESLRDEPKKGKICAIMVTYNPDSPLEQNIRAVLPQVDKLIIVDNGSELPIRAHIEAIASSCAVQVIWNNENLGLATALNIGIRSALGSDDFDWIATFDQDSRVAAGFRDAMLQAYLACPYRQSVGIIGPHHVELTENSTAGLSHHEEHDRFREITAVMQSGTFLSTEALRSCGLFDDSFFIDYVDFELCLRIRKNGLRIIEAPNATIVHRLGNPSRHNRFGRTFTVCNHSALRRYYAARNRFRIYFRYLFSDFAWICHDIWLWSKELIKLVLFEEDRAKKLAYIARGGWDALRGRGGMYSRSNRLERE
jgi:rhamnosyltransferase